MKQGRLLRGMARTFAPGFVATLYYYVRYSATVSPRAEIDITRNIRFGRGCIVASFAKIKASEGPLRLGNRGGIGSGCFISAGEGAIVIGDNFICGPNVSIVGQNYVHDKKGIHLEDQGVISKGITIGDNVWIGASSTITDGSHLGHNTVVVANSLVNGRFPDDVILCGCPARVIFRR
jgi:acetyltransferase-like isoleucine patch superfamily enzyme